MRKSGYYWVKGSQKWRIAEYLDGVWYINGVSLKFYDNDFIKIDERQITREPKQ